MGDERTSDEVHLTSLLSQERKSAPQRGPSLWKAGFAEAVEEAVRIDLVSILRKSLAQDFQCILRDQPSQIVDLDSYLLADVRISVSVSRRIEVFARGENLLDEEYEDVLGFRASGIAGFAGIRFRADRN